MDRRRGVVLFTAGLALTAVSSVGRERAEAVASISREQAAVAYAPHVYLHPDERWQPMNPDLFIEISELSWAQDNGCRGVRVALSPDAGDLSGQSGKVYWHRLTSTGPRCVDEGPWFPSNGDVRPRHKGNATGNEGFYLDIPDSQRGGEGPTAPVYYDIRGRTILYWFFYGFSDADGGFNHEGDWEHVALRLGPDNRPRDIVYFHHSEQCTAPYVDNGKRPVVYSALGTHGSWPTHGLHPYAHSGDETVQGPSWKAWGRLVSLTRQRWYGFGGAWGQVGKYGSTTGPRGSP